MKQYWYLNDNELEVAICVRVCSNLARSHGGEIRSWNVFFYIFLFGMCKCSFFICFANFWRNVNFCNRKLHSIEFLLIEFIDHMAPAHHVSHLNNTSLCSPFLSIAIILKWIYIDKKFSVLMRQNNLHIIFKLLSAFDHLQLLDFIIKLLFSFFFSKYRYIDLI